VTILDQPHQIEFFKLAQVCSRLKIETGTGLKFKQSTLAACQRYYFTNRAKVATKQKAFELLDAAKARVLEGADIYREIAQLRNAKLFFICTNCGWRGDEFFVGQSESGDEGFHCPNCKMDESGLQIEEFKKGSA
jgi:hypothetical protein